MPDKPSNVRFFLLKGNLEHSISCSMRTLYRQFKRDVFDCSSLPMKGKCKPNGLVDKRGKQAFKRQLSDRIKDYPDFNTEFGHLEGDTIVGVHHKSAIINLVERISKTIITLKPKERKAMDIETSITQWLSSIPRHLFQSMTFDCGKEFSNWKNISNDSDSAIFFQIFQIMIQTQRRLNEHSNGLLRRNDLPKTMDFNHVDQAFVSSVASKRNHIPRKSLNYYTPLEVFMRYVDEEKVSGLISQIIY